MCIIVMDLSFLKQSICIPSVLVLPTLDRYNEYTPPRTLWNAILTQWDTLCLHNPAWQLLIRPFLGPSFHCPHSSFVSHSRLAVYPHFALTIFKWHSTCPLVKIASIILLFGQPAVCVVWEIPSRCRSAHSWISKHLWTPAKVSKRANDTACGSLNI